MSPHDIDEFQRISALIAQNIGKVAVSIARLAQAVESSNEIAVKHHRWERRDEE